MLNKTYPASDRIDELSRQYLDLLAERLCGHTRTYGFEYEFLPDRVLNISDMARLDRLLADLGGEPAAGDRLFDDGLRVTFEPGGQIEYCSPPLRPDELSRLERLLECIEWINAQVHDKLAINYLGTEYIPGRAGGPLCLRSTRYLNLHRLLATSGTRGHDMMKGTAAIHLHVAICSIEELPLLFRKVCELSRDELFKMSENRRQIWNNTDPTRCGFPPCCLEASSSAEELIGQLVRYAQQVMVLGEEVPFKAASDQSFGAFLHLLTTIFTDIRFNMKGPTIELRTLDSVPVDQFKCRWQAFVDRLETD